MSPPQESDHMEETPVVVNTDDDSEEYTPEIPTAGLINSEVFTTSAEESGRQQASGTGWFAASMLIVNAGLGAGLLNFPAAYHQAGGIVTANIVQMVLMCFIVPALVILAYCSDHSAAKTLQEVLRFAGGKRAEQVTSFFIALYCFGTCVTFLIIIGDQFDRVFASLYGSDFCTKWYLNRIFTTVSTSILIILPFCYPKKIDFLKHISTVGVLSVIYVVLLIVLQYFRGGYTTGEIKTKPTHFSDILLVVPTICFGYQCHVSVIPIYSCFKKRTLTQFTASATLAIIICVITYSVAASFGYLTFGGDVQSDILMSYDAHDPYVLVAIIAISIKTYTTYPILSFCGNAALMDLWKDLSLSFGNSEVNASMNEKIRVISITCWFSISLLFAVLMPNIGSVIELLGSLAAVFIFVFPGICLLQMAEYRQLIGHGSKTQLRSLIGCSAIFLAIGAFIFGCVLTRAILDDFIYEKAESISLCVIST